MASYLEETTINLENNTHAVMNGKNANQLNTDKGKLALGDIKNAALPTGEQKLSVKKVRVEIADEENIENEFASSLDVDYHAAWAEKLALTDDEINRWINMLNIARDMNPYDEITPPVFVEEEIPQTIDDNEFPAPLVAPSLPSSPIFNSSGYFSLDGSSIDEGAQSSSIHNDTETSDLDKSVFELELDSDSDNEWIMN